MTPQFVIACYPWSSGQENQLSLEAGKVYQIVSETDNGWARGHDLQGNEGFFPSSFVKPCTEEEVKYIMDSAQVVPPSQLTPRDEESPPVLVNPTQSTEVEEVSMSEIASSQHDSESDSAIIPVVKSPAVKKKRRTSRKMSRSTLHELSKDESSTDMKRKKKKKRPEKASTHRKRTRSQQIETEPRKMNSVRRLQEFEKRTWRKEIDWSMTRVNQWKDSSSLLSGSPQAARFVHVQQQYRIQTETALGGGQTESLRTLVEQHVAEVEGCEWEIFERHEALKSQWGERKELMNSKMEVLWSFLDRFLRLQQAQVFGVASEEVTTLIEEVKGKAIVSNLSSTSEIDPWIQVLRSQLDREREYMQRIDALCSFYEQVTEMRSAALFYLVLCDLATHVWASANTANEATVQNAGAPEADHTGPLCDVLQPLLESNITIHNLTVTFASLLSKVMASWGSSQTDIDAYVHQGSSLTELFAQILAYECTQAFRSQLNLMSEKGATDFAQAVLVRGLALIAAEQIDLTRPVIDQVVTKLSLTVIPSHSRPEEGQSSITVQGTNTTILFPSVLETAVSTQSHDRLVDDILHGRVPQVSEAPQAGYIDAQILTCAGWEVCQHTPPLSYHLRHPKVILHVPLGHRTATIQMVEFLTELGWRAQEEEVRTVKESPDSPSLESSAGAEQDEVLALQDQLKRQQELIDQNTNALAQLSRTILSLQQELVAQQQSRVALDTLIQSLHTQLVIPSATSPDMWKPLPAVPPKTG